MSIRQHIYNFLTDLRDKELVSKYNEYERKYNVIENNVIDYAYNNPAYTNMLIGEHYGSGLQNGGALENKELDKITEQFGKYQDLPELEQVKEEINKISNYVNEVLSNLNKDSNQKPNEILDNPHGQEYLSQILDNILTDITKYTDNMEYTNKHIRITFNDAPENLFDRPNDYKYTQQELSLLIGKITSMINGLDICIENMVNNYYYFKYNDQEIKYVRSLMEIKNNISSRPDIYLSSLLTKFSEYEGGIISKRTMVDFYNNFVVTYPQYKFFKYFDGRYTTLITDDLSVIELRQYQKIRILDEVVKQYNKVRGIELGKQVPSQIEDINIMMEKYKRLVKQYKQKSKYYNKIQTQNMIDLLFYVLIITNKIYEHNYVVFDYIDKTLLRYYGDIIKDILNKFTKISQYKEVLYFKTYHYVTLVKLQYFIEEMIPKIACNTVDVSRCTGETASRFLLLNYTKTVLDRYNERYGNKIKLIDDCVHNFAGHPNIKDEYIEKYLGLDTKLMNNKSILLLICGNDHQKQKSFIFGDDDNEGLLEGTLNNIIDLKKLDFKIVELFKDDQNRHAVTLYNLVLTADSLELNNHINTQIDIFNKHILNNNNYVTVPRDLCSKIFRNFDVFIKYVEKKQHKNSIIIYDMKIYVKNSIVPFIVVNVQNNINFNNNGIVITAQNILSTIDKEFRDVLEVYINSTKEFRILIV